MDLTLTPQWSIELESDSPVARFAAEELRRTLRRIGAPALPVAPRADGPRIALRHGQGGDGFLRAPDQGGLLLRGDGPRGLLYAVYDLLESLGCCWVAPGPDGERLPRHERVTLPANGKADRPAICGRGLIIGHDHFLAEAEPWVEWAARSRLSTIFIHTIGHGPAMGACRLSSWRARRRVLLPLIAERGLDIELGGHHLSDLVPRRLFRERPELFRHDGTHRTPDRNFCPSHPETQAILRERGGAFFKAYPEARVYHLWPDDLLGGGWCACPRCAGLTAADQALLAANTLAEALATLRPDASVSYLAYHDTEDAPRALRPHPQAALIFAPRPRSYAQGIGDPASPINAPYAARLAENLALFGSRGSGVGSRGPDTALQHSPPAAQRWSTDSRLPPPEPSPPVAQRWSTDSRPPTPDSRPPTPEPSPPAAQRWSTDSRPPTPDSCTAVFEYYLDGILFKSSVPPLPELIAADMAHYRAAGVGSVHALMTGDRPWAFPPLNAYLFARLAWSPEQDVGALLAVYAAARAPRAPEALARAYTALGLAWRAALDRTPAEAGQRREVVGSHDVVATPPLDVLDYMAAPRPHSERRMERLRAAEDDLALGRVAWGEVMATAFADAPALAAERAEWELGAALLHFLALRQQLYVLAERGATRQVLRQTLDAAQAALDALSAWAGEHVPPRARAGHLLLRAIFQLHIDHIADRQLALPWQRAALRARRAAAARAILADPRLAWELLRNH
ncbi:DUF4838 domain-containing protein [Chloroflexales bacterium ZM16-3]|nr:DUF4838 domain-containing protein [Chloroflexales bacterium ZM16-3]